MLSWSNGTYKLTLGVGTLALAGMMAERWETVLPAWIAVAICLPPVAIFVAVHPGELSPRVVRGAHVFASVWYLLAAVVLLVSLLTLPKLPRGWVVYPLFAAVGAVPCGIVLTRVALKRYLASEEDGYRGPPRRSSSEDEDDFDLDLDLG